MSCGAFSSFMKEMTQFCVKEDEVGCKDVRLLAKFTHDGQC